MSKRILPLDIIDRTGCPTCEQRGYRELDCVTCGGIGYVDADKIAPIIEETIIDIQRGTTSLFSHEWLPDGLYPFEDGRWFVIENDSLRQIDESEVDSYLAPNEFIRLPAMHRIVDRCFLAFRSIFMRANV